MTAEQTLRELVGACALMRDEVAGLRDAIAPLAADEPRYYTALSTVRRVDRLIEALDRARGRLA